MTVPITPQSIPELSVAAFTLSPAEFTRVSRLAYEQTRIVLQPGKEGLVIARLSKRLRALGLTSFSAYLDHVESEPDGRELSQLVDVITTNKTHFFRERPHFDFLARVLVPEHLERRTPLRVWSAGCSSGEEPYTIAMVLHDTERGAAARDARILGTDISSRVLSRAAAAEYAAEAVGDVPKDVLTRHFVSSSARHPASYRVRDEVRALVRFARLNLMGEWPMRQAFHAIFCRNVMIYFDRDTQEQLVRRFGALLAPGGYLFVGHSESLSAIDHGLRYVAPAVYVK